MKFNDIIQSKLLKVVLAAIVAAAFLLIIFNFGMFIGFNKASFAYKWSENYHKNFGGPRGGFFRQFTGKNFIDSYGSVGQILSVDGDEIIIEGKDNVEKIILTDNKTIVKRFRDTIKPSQLNPGDNIVVIGEPDATGKIKAKFIRVMPALPPTMDNSYYFHPFKRMF